MSEDADAARRARNAEYQREFVRRRKERGMCIRCPSPVVPGRTMCARCQMLANASTRKVRKSLKQTGRCLRCRKPCGKSFCPVCAKKQYAELLARNRRNRNKGLCGCGRPPQPDRKQCKECLEKEKRQYRAKVAKDPAFREKCYRKNKQLMDDLRSKGLCNWCRGPSPNGARCDGCRARTAAHRKRKREQAPDVCSRCLKPREDAGFKLCVGCRAYVREKWREHVRKKKAE